MQVYVNTMGEYIYEVHQSRPQTLHTINARLSYGGSGDETRSTYNTSEKHTYVQKNLVELNSSLLSRHFSVEFRLTSLNLRKSFINSREFNLFPVLRWIVNFAYNNYCVKPCKCVKYSYQTSFMQNVSLHAVHISQNTIKVSEIIQKKVMLCCFSMSI